MEFAPGYVVNMDMVRDVCEWLQGRLADIILHFHPHAYSAQIVGALRSEMNVYLAYLGHLRLDRWSPLPAAHPFTVQLKLALESEDRELLRKLPISTSLPPRAGQISALSEGVFPKWWLDVDVLSPGWKPFDLGEHICNYHASLLREVSAGAAPGVSTASQASEDVSVTTSAKFQEEMSMMRNKLAAARAEIYALLEGVKEIWEEDYRLYTETNEHWDEVLPPRSGQ